MGLTPAQTADWIYENTHKVIRRPTFEKLMGHTHTHAHTDQFGLKSGYSHWRWARPEEAGQKRLSTVYHWSCLSWPSTTQAYIYSNRTFNESLSNGFMHTKSIRKSPPVISLSSCSKWITWTLEKGRRFRTKTKTFTCCALRCVWCKKDIQERLFSLSLLNKGQPIWIFCQSFDLK